MSTADLIWVLQFLLGGFGVVLWSMFRDTKKDLSTLQSEVDTNKQELQNYKLHVAEKYVTSTSLEKALETVIDSIKAMFVKLDKIEEKLDKKADK